MKKIVLLLLLFTFSCKSDSKELKSPEIENNLDKFNVIIIEDCEYLEYDKGALEYATYGLTHKGNCKNPIHEYNK